MVSETIQRDFDFGSSLFQWGHDPEVMVSLIKMTEDVVGGLLFQWGHDPEVMVRALY